VQKFQSFVVTAEVCNPFFETVCSDEELTVQTRLFKWSCILNIWQSLLIGRQITHRGQTWRNFQVHGFGIL